YSPHVEASSKLDSGSLALLIENSARWANRSFNWFDPIPPFIRDAKFNVGLSLTPNSVAGDIFG
ncbi:hypothetical protein K449DRAFT_341458, partial [Hypoxylon sp. EC38]